VNPAHLHLVVNHIPVIGGPIALALLVWGALARDRSLRRAGCLLTVLLAVSCWVAVYTGESAEDLIESLDGVNRPAIHPHEERAEAAWAAFLVAGALAAAALLLPEQPRGGWGRRVPPPAARALLVAAALAVGIALVVSAASLGGRIRHPEVDLVAAEQSPRN